MWRGLQRSALAARRIRFSQQREWIHSTSASAEATITPATAADLKLQHAAKSSIDQLKDSIRHAAVNEERLQTWNTLMQHQPVVFKHRVACLATASDLSSSEAVAVRMVSMEELLELTRNGARDQVVDRVIGVPAAELSDESEEQSELAITWVPLPVSDDRVVQVSEQFVAHMMMKAMSGAGDSKAWCVFMEEYEQRMAALTTEDREIIAKYEQSNPEAAQLAAHRQAQFDVMYTTAFSSTPGYAARIVARAKPYQDDLGRFIFNRNALRYLVEACSTERDGDLARALIDQTMDKFPNITFNHRPFKWAIQANVRGEPKTLAGLHNAMHLYRRMRFETEYILLPSEWSLLFNTCVYLDEPELAIEVFRDYRAHGIVPFQQNRFRSALRLVILKQRYDLLIAMVKEWIKIEAVPPADPWLISPDTLLRDEAACFNWILIALLNAGDATSLDHIEAVLDLMQQRGIRSSLRATQFLVNYYVVPQEEEDDSPSDVIDRFFTLLDRFPSVVLPSRYLVTVVSDQCTQLGWTDQLDMVQQYNDQHYIKWKAATWLEKTAALDDDIDGNGRRMPPRSRSRGYTR